MRNFDIPLDNFQRPQFWEENGVSELKREESEGGGRESSTDGSVEDPARVNIESLGDLSPEVLSYIQQLESELSAAKQVMTPLQIYLCIAASSIQNPCDCVRLR